MGFSWSERERRAAEELARRNGRVNFMSVETQVEVLNLVKREKLEEETAAERKMAEIAARDAAIAQKYGGPEAWQKVYDGSSDKHRRLLRAIKTNPELPAEQAQVAVITAMGLEREAEEKRQTLLGDQTDELLKLLNKATQKRQPPNPKHPLYQIVKKERRLERELNPKPPRKPAAENWRTKLIAGDHWKNARKWFGMTEAEKAAAEAEIANALNTEIGPVAQALTGQAEWNALEASGEAEQLDFSGFYWPTDEK